MARDAAATHGQTDDQMDFDSEKPSYEHFCSRGHTSPHAPRGTHHAVSFSTPVALPPQPQELAGPEGPGTAFGQTTGGRGTNSPAPHFPQPRSSEGQLSHALHSPRGPQWDQTPTARRAYLPFDTPSVGFLPFPPHFPICLPLFLEVTSQVNCFHSNP